MNAIAPGLIDTDMGARTPAIRKQTLRESSALRRIGQPKEIASVTNFLVSEDTNFITCATIDVEGS